MNHDPLLQQEAIEFVRIAVHKADPKFARSLAGTIKNICQSGQVNRQEIWAQLSAQEQERFRVLVESERLQNLTKPNES